MSIFGRTTFSATGYAAARPTYPPFLPALILSHHTTPRTLLLDLGCGPGIVTAAFAPFFPRILGLDPSSPMVTTAQKAHAAIANLSFRVGSAEDLSFLADGEVSVVTAGQACHWFDYEKVWPELARVVGGGGTLAFWGYNDNILVGYPEATKVFFDFSYREDRDGDVAPGMHSMQRYWEQPGRSIVRGHLQEVVPPAGEWEVLMREMFFPDKERCIVTEEDRKGKGLWLERRMTLGGFEAYVRTYSAYKGWVDANPGFKRRSEGGTGDIVDVMMDKMRQVTPEWRGEGEAWRDIEVDAVWGTALIIAKRRNI